MSAPTVQLPPRVAIACGGTGGHLFPGLAVSHELRAAGCETALLVSEKEIDQRALEGQASLQTVALPGVGLSRGKELAFLRGFAASYRQASRTFHAWRPDAVLAMGGFTCAAPVLAGRRMGASVFLHESNTVPGRANRWLSWITRRAFVGFPAASKLLHSKETIPTGTPVRPEFQPRDAKDCRRELGLDPQRPVLLVMGGSQGASPINRLVIGALPGFARFDAKLQLLFLTGKADAEAARRACADNAIDAQVHEFLSRMDLALGAATVAVSRAGASSLAEIAAMHVPAVLIPYPTAADNHQFHNARAFADTRAAILCQQADTSPGTLAERVCALLNDASGREQMKQALALWHVPDAARQIATSLLAVVRSRGSAPGTAPGPVSLRRLPEVVA